MGSAGRPPGSQCGDTCRVFESLLKMSAFVWVFIVLGQCSNRSPCSNKRPGEGHVASRRLLLGGCLEGAGGPQTRVELARGEQPRSRGSFGGTLAIHDRQASKSGPHLIPSFLPAS